MTETITRADYLQFFRDVLDFYEQDFPSRIIEMETLTNVPDCKILQTFDIARWSIAELNMYEFTGERGYLERGSQLVSAVVNGYLHTPMEVWDYYPLETREGTESCREAYQRVPEEAKWRGYAWWHVGGGAEPLGLSLACQALDRAQGWESPKLREEALTALARLTDYHVLDEFQVDRRHSYAWCRGATHNIAMTMTRGIFGAATLMPDHPHAEQWRQWAEETFRRSFNQPSPEDASNYESDWFHSILTMIDLLGKGEDAYCLPHHRACFEHLKEMITPSGAVVGYGDSGDRGNAAILPVLEKGAAVFRDGTYKHAAHRHFKAIRALSPEEKAGYVEPLRWFDAYRWADDSVEPEPPCACATVTHTGKAVLRSGRTPDQSYLALSSLDGGGHGHFDAMAIAYLGKGRSELLRDGHYHWKQAFFHNRLLWREGKAPGALLDYFRPQKTPFHTTADGTGHVFSSEGPAEGVEDKWHPDAEVSMKVEFLADFPQFKAVRAALGPQERTVVLTAGSGVLVFDHLVAETTTTAVCLYYTSEVVDRGEWWVRGRDDCYQIDEDRARAFAAQRTTSSILRRDDFYQIDEDFREDLLIASLEPRKLSTEPQERRDVMEQVVFNSKVGEFPKGTWFVTALWPQDKQAKAVDLAEVMELEAADGMAEESPERIVTIRQEQKLVTYICRAGNQPGPLSYRPVKPDGSPYPWNLETDADLLRLEPVDRNLHVTMVNGTVLSVAGKELLSLPYATSQQTTVQLSINPNGMKEI